MDHDHDNPSEFEAGCPVCELDEVSLQDTGRPWAARVMMRPSLIELPTQPERRAS